MVDETRQTIRRFIETQLQAEELSDDEDLIDAGYVNSLFAIQLVLFVERQFRISVQDGDLDLANFRSISVDHGIIYRHRKHRHAQINQDPGQKGGSWSEAPGR